MRRAALGVALTASFSMLTLFCAPPGEAPIQFHDPIAAEWTPPRPTPFAPTLDADAEDVREAELSRASEPADASLLQEPDAGPTPYRGGLDPKQIRDVVVAHRRALQACYEIEAQKDPTLRGGVTADWTIDMSGVVANATVSNSTIHDAFVEGCILRQVNSWRFPPSNGPSKVKFPFSFGIRHKIDGPPPP
jgi:hypothetical protein